MNYKDICAAIVDGEVGPKTFDAIRQAMNHVEKRSFYEISAGDIVQFNSRANPKYLYGLQAEVTKRNRKTYTIEMLRGAGRFRKGEIVRAPMSIVEKVR